MPPGCGHGGWPPTPPRACCWRRCCGSAGGRGGPSDGCPPPAGHDLPALAASFAAGTLASAPVFAGFIALGTFCADWPDRILRPGRWRRAWRRPVRAVHAVAAMAPRARRGERALTWVALPWLLLPPAVLLIAAEFKPVYEFMYLEYCLPAVALLVGAGLAASAGRCGWPLSAWS